MNDDFANGRCDALARVAGALAPYLADAYTVGVEDATTTLEEVLITRLRTIRAALERMGLDLDGGCLR